MQQNFSTATLNKIKYLVGDANQLSRISELPAKKPFDSQIVELLNSVSRVLMSNPKSKAYSDVVTFAFWIRKGSVLKLKERFANEDGELRFGRGVAFHIAPSNVPVNFAYSLVSGLLTGNANVVRVPSKEFEQVKLIADAFNTALEEYKELTGYVLLLRYDRDKEVNDLLSSLADTRIIWGGDETIKALRESEIPPRSTEITFADRFSLSIIDSDKYLALDDKNAFALDFYNDTYFSDQNACTSPRIVVWTGSHIEEAKGVFWEKLHDMVSKKYSFQNIQSVNKLTAVYKAVEAIEGARLVAGKDNLITRISLDGIPKDLMNYRENSGFFFEYDCDDILDIRAVCDDKRCQTIGLLGSTELLKPLFESGVKGIDRIVPIGKTMDFDLIWDGYDLPTMMTRKVVLA